MNMRELAEYTGVSRNTLLNWAKDNGMPVHKRGRGHFITKHTFLKWVVQYAWARDKVSRPECVEELVVYHKAALYDFINSQPAYRSPAVGHVEP